MNNSRWRERLEVEGRGESSILMLSSKMSCGEDGSQSYGKAVQKASQAGDKALVPRRENTGVRLPLCALSELPGHPVWLSGFPRIILLIPPSALKSWRLHLGTLGGYFSRCRDQSSYEEKTRISMSCDLRSVYSECHRSRRRSITWGACRWSARRLRREEDFFKEFFSLKYCFSFLIPLRRK